MKSQLQLFQEAYGDQTFQQQNLAMLENLSGPAAGGFAPDSGYFSQVGAFFRQTNTVRNAYMAINKPFFVDDPSYNPSQDIEVTQNEWIKSVYPEAFVRLMKSTSRMETNHLVNQVKEEHADRQIIENAGLLGNIASGLTAGLVDPVNWVAMGGAMKAAKAAGLATRPLAVGAVGATENVLALTAAEPFLQAAQATRTTEEFQRDLVGGAVFGSILGGVMGSVSSGRTAVNRRLLGADSAEDAIDPNSYRQWLADNPSDQQRLDDLLEGSEGFSIFGEDRAELAGILLKATQEINPGLARILGTGRNNFLSRMLVRMLFLNPEMNLARSQSQFARGALDIILKPAIVRTDTLNRQSVEAVMGIAEIAALRVRHTMDEAFAEYRSGGGTLNHAQVMEIAGRAAVRGDVVDPHNTLPDYTLSPTDGTLVQVNPFEGLDEAGVKVVEKIAKTNRKFFDAFRKTAIAVGAFTEQDFVDPDKLANYLTRRYLKDKIKAFDPQFKEAVRLGLAEKKSLELPELELERDGRTTDLNNLQARLGRMADDDPDRAALTWDRDQLVREIEDYETAISLLGDESQWDYVADLVQQNITDDISDGPTGLMSNSLKRRVLDIDDRFLAGFVETNVSNIQAHQIRTLLPKLIMSGELDKSMDGFQVSRKLQSKLTATTKKLEKLQSDPNNLNLDKISEVRLDLELLLDDAAHLRLSTHLRLQLDVERLGFSSMQEAQVRVNDLVTALKKTKRELSDKARRLELHDLEITRATSALSTAQGRHLGRTVIQNLQDTLDTLKQNRRDLKNDIKMLRLEGNDTRGSLGNISEQMLYGTGSASERLGGNTATRRQELRFGANYLSMGGAITEEQKLVRLMMLKNSVVNRVSNARREAYEINLHDEQMLRRIQEDYGRLRKDVDQNTRMTFKRKKREKEKLLKQEARDLEDMKVIFKRFHKTDGVGNEGLGRVGKTIRDANYVRLGGGFLLSSAPDPAMIIAQVGLPTFIRSMARYMNPFFRKERLSEDMGDWLFSAEAVLGGERNRRIAGLDNLDPERATWLERGMQNSATYFSKALMLNKWNGMMKDISSSAIQHKLIKIGNKKRAGKRLSRSDKAFIEGLGLDDDRLKRIAQLQEEFGENGTTLLGGQYHIARTRRWGKTGSIDSRVALEDRLAFERAVFQRVQQTIVTPGAGSLPRWMSSTEMGRIIGQFGSFTMAATNQVLVPMVQKGAMMGDFNQVIMFVGASTLGAMGYWARQSLNGKNPFEDEVKRDKRGRVIARVPWWKKSIMEGIDRGGTLGWLTQGNAMMERMTGVGVSTALGAGQLSRMQTRSKVDILAGPSAGFINDLGTLMGATSAKLVEGKPFTEGAYNAGRRMLWGQNLTQTRLALDVAPTLYEQRDGGYGNPTYPETFVPVQQRLRNFLQGL